MSKINKNKKFFFLLFFIIILLSIFYPLKTFSQKTKTIELFEKNIQFPGVTSDISYYIKKFYEFSIRIAGILAIFGILLGSIYYSISGAIDKKKEALAWIYSSIGGLILIFSINLFLNLINPDLVNLDKIINRLSVNIPKSTTTLELQEKESYLLINNGYDKSKVEEIKKLATNIYNEFNNNPLFKISDFGNCRLNSDYITLLNKRTNVASPITPIEALKEGYLPPICGHGCSQSSFLCKADLENKTIVSASVLYALNFIASQTKLTTSIFSSGIRINSITTGDHSKNSNHYKGKAVDFSPLCNNKTDLGDCWKKTAEEIKKLSEVNKVICEATLKNIEISCRNTTIDPEGVKDTYSDNKKIDSKTVIIEVEKCDLLYPSGNQTQNIITTSTNASKIDLLKGYLRPLPYDCNSIKINKISSITNQHIHVEFK